jgi:hypothetical protein
MLAHLTQQIPKPDRAIRTRLEPTCGRPVDAA